MNRLDNHQPLTSSKIFLLDQPTITQSFVAHYNNLNIVKICLRNPDHVISPLTFTLHEATSSALPIRQLVFSTANIDNNDCTRFQFEKIIDSKGKTYVATVAGPKAEVYSEAHDGELHYQTYYSQPYPEVIKESFSQLGSRLGQDPLFILGYLTLIVIIVYRFFKL